MKRLLVSLAVVALCASGLSAQPMQFDAQRDVSNNANPGESPNNTGAIAWERTGKGPWYETYIVDFDTDAIQQWLTDNPLGADERYKFEFRVMPVGAWPDPTGDPPVEDPAGYTVEVWTLNLLEDWAEGDGTGRMAPYNWAAGAPAMTDWYAQHYWYLDPVLFIPVDDVDNCVPWADEDGVEYGSYFNTYELHKLQNSESFWANFELYLSYISVELDEEVWQDLVYNEFNRGLATCGGDNWANSYVLAIEQNNPAQVPNLLVEIVPTVTLPVPGDTNDDGWVDGADYTNWADNYLSSPVPAWEDGGWTVGNFNADDTVDGADYTVWADNYNPPPPGGAVPEPATLMLLGAGAALLLRRKRA